MCHGMEHGSGCCCHGEHGGFEGWARPHHAPHHHGCHHGPHHGPHPSLHHDLHHTCPACGEPHGAEAGHGMEAGHGPHQMAHRAVKELLFEKTKAKIDARWGGRLDAIVQELVDMAEEKMKLKKEMWQRKKEMKERLHEIFAETMGGQG